jgi:hypothetical protein
MANEQGRTDHVANTMPSPYYHFDGASAKVDLGNSEHVRNLAGGYTISAWVKLANMPTDTNVGSVIFENYTSLKGMFFSIKTTGQLHSRHHGTGATASNGIKALTTDTWYHVVKINTGTQSKFYIDGVQDQATWNDVGEWTPSHAATIGSWGGGSMVFDGDINNFRLYNTALTADEVKELYSGASVPFKYKGASQTNKVTNGDFATGDFTGWGFSGTGATYCSIVSGQLYIDGLTHYSDRGYITQYIDTLEVGKEYNMTFDYAVSTNTLRFDPDGAYNGDVSITGSGTYNVNFTASSAAIWLHFYGLTGSPVQAYVDNFTLTQIGAVAEYDGSSATTSTWYDKSGNGLDGTVTGATLENKVQALEVGGSLGIGVSDASSKLHIKGNFESSYALKFTNTLGTGKVSGFRSHGTNGESLSLYHDGKRMQRWESNGNHSFEQSNVGIYAYGGSSASPTESADWPTPALSIRTYDGYFRNSVMSLGYAGDSVYQTGNNVWNFRLHDRNNTYNVTTSSANTDLELYGPGNLKLNSNIVMTNGNGIDFSATADGSGTSTSELLDDYETGTWTPTPQSTGGGEAMSYYFTEGNYTKIGNMVTVTGGFGFTSVSGGSSYFYIGGLPFSTVSGKNGSGSVRTTACSWGGRNMSPQRWATSSFSFLGSNDNGGGWAWTQWSWLASNSAMYFSFTYQT